MTNQTATLPLAWVEKVFRKLTVVYGRDFMARWEGQEINDVIEDWAEELSGFVNWPEAIAWALKNLPDSKPPTVLEFRALCFKAPKPERLALPEPAADPVFAKQVLGQVSRKPAGVNVYTDWIRRGLADLEAGVRKSPTVERMIREAAVAKGVA